MPIREDIIERANARLGTVLKGKWRLDAVIGIGGMASVYAATHRNQARVAIKLLHAEVAMDAEVNARFLREGYVANAVGHPGTVTVLDDDVSEDKAPFLVMELLIGQTLDTMLALAPDGVPAREVLPLIDQLLEVLTAAHEKGIVHRDLKPENLFLTSEGRLKVLDFGIARLRELSVHSVSATQAGSVLGTPAFMAPEQALGRWNDVDGRTDIWAVGATAFTLLTGQHVHEAESLQEQLVLSATRPARRVREVAPNVPEELARVIDQALGFSRNERFADARAMRGALRSAWPSVLSQPSAPSSPRMAESTRVSRHEALHGATLLAPIEVTSAITGRAETGSTGSMTRSTVVSGQLKRHKAPLLALLAGLCVIGAVVLWFVEQTSTVLPPVLPTAALTASGGALRLPASAAVAPPAVAPTLEEATSSAPALARSAPVVILQKPALVAASHPVARPAPVFEKLQAKSLVGGGDNPFDRRH
jgi:serine/threonine protein kinase